MIAYKYPSEEKEAIIRMIELTVGRTGRINPTAVFSDESQKPLQLCGTSVTRATLHNQDYIDELGIDVGARVLVYKSGDIIPKIKKVISGTGKTYKIPEYCPAVSYTHLYNKVFGYYLEVTNSYKDLVPDYFMRKQTLANAERYICLLYTSRCV